MNARFMAAAPARQVEAVVDERADRVALVLDLPALGGRDLDQPVREGPERQRGQVRVAEAVAHRAVGDAARERLHDDFVHAVSRRGAGGLVQGAPGSWVAVGCAW